MGDIKYQETMALIRHYSALRFAMLTVFTVITGGLLSAAHSPALQIDENIFCINVIRFAGIWISLVFLIFEIALNVYLAGLWSEASHSSSMYRNCFITWAVRLAAGSIPVMAFIYWLGVYAG